MKDPLVEKLEAEIRYLRKLLDDNARRLPKSCWNSAASVKNSGLFRQSAAQGAWLYTGSLGDVVRQVQIWAIGS